MTLYECPFSPSWPKVPKPFIGIQGDPLRKSPPKKRSPYTWNIQCEPYILKCYLHLTAEHYVTPTIISNWYRLQYVWSDGYHNCKVVRMDSTLQAICNSSCSVNNHQSQVTIQLSVWESTVWTTAQLTTAKPNTHTRKGIFNWKFGLFSCVHK